jgi:hypothetical protein
MDANKMILTVKAGPREVQITIPVDTDIEEFKQACQALAVGVGFLPETVKEGF